ncbi:hypothetical protein [Pararobbsia silviterrae]|uniref:Uncharacterized protein n=1 Tax=Pararobbsia silviterrae TaxID=1792498 RepID=A0A494XSJ2_9BURK|nr:hypothetical protein [Pararobbsia silviterrae]RKP53612.1 hypothetical protein D7S86_15170 [Pararobbsia silviterrae]
MTSKVRLTARRIAHVRLDTLLLGAGGLSVAVGLAWWYIVFRPVLNATYLKYSDALTCVATTTDLCALAQALCLNQHFLGITRYSTSVFWMATALLGAGALASGWRSQHARVSVVERGRS